MPDFAAGFRANGLVTLTTDFGWREPFVGIMKGVMLARAPHLRFVDMAHEVSAFQPVEAGFWMSRAVRYFAPGTLHVAVIDPGVGTPRDLIVAITAGQAILAPDNGLLAPLAARGHIERVIRLHNTRLVAYGVSDISATFHGRDVFAPVAAELAAGRCDPDDLGEEITSINLKGWPATRARADGGVEGEIVAIDRFGNLISNVEAGAVMALEHPTVYVAGLSLPLKRTYGEAEPGEYLGLINSFEVLEVARARGSAAQGLSLGLGTPISAVPGTATVHFRRS
jgi:S-adenosylmethionine hydrolase